VLSTEFGEKDFAADRSELRALPHRSRLLPSLRAAARLVDADPPDHGRGAGALRGLQQCSSSASRATPWKRPAEELAADMRALFEQLLAPEQSK